MRTIGTVTRLQIQRGSLKTGEKPTRTYDPTPLLAVPAVARVTGWRTRRKSRGHVGRGRPSSVSPRNKKRDGLHGISLGFTSHYDAMREHFGDRVVVGCAGENIIASSDRQFSYDDLAAGVAILSPDGQERVRLKVLQVAHPCRPFTDGHSTNRSSPKS